uniref:Uncharacterized protein n=1 Tax=Anguilla anguilla TaxID=7936 RepID=A0A0E9PMG9_ANGAN
MLLPHTNCPVIIFHPN